MTLLKRVGIAASALIIIGCATEFAAHRAITGITGFVSTANAVVGRPLTPVSVAGVARRTTRRCAVGVYNC
jgi:hypothetical protein